MEEDQFQGVVCEGSWWNSSRNLFGSSPCSAAVNNSPWLNPNLIVDIETAISISDDSASDGGSSVVLQEAPNPQPHLTASNPNNMSINDSSLHIMADDWNQNFLNESARSQENYSHMLQVQSLNSRMNCHKKLAEEWSNEDFSSDSSSPQNFLVQKQSTNSISFNTASYNHTSSLLPSTLFAADSHHQPLLQTDATSYSSSPNFLMSSAGVLPTAMKSSFPKQQQLGNNFQFINNTNFWNATSASRDVRASFLPSSTPQLIPSALTKPKLNQQNFGSKSRNGKSGEAGNETKNRGINEAAFKRPRIETPSPLPTFKVRKEKLGDRVTALQQLVSPFGKTDTASVLHEAIDYIKLLHDQVIVLSAPYLKNGPPLLQHQQAHDKMKDREETKRDLRSKGLCLVPISSTFPVATETTADFWTPTFGASFR